MKKMLTILGILLLLAAAVVGGGVGYLMLAYPKAPKPADIAIEPTPERLERGRYLANHVAACIDCHSNRDWNYFGGPIVPGSEGMGGEAFLEEYGFPGNLYANNITPAAIGDWSDGELVRAITSGVSKDGKPLFPLMPYPNYRKMASEDVYAIAAYIRSLKPVENQTPESKLNFPLNLIVRTIPGPADPQPLPDPADTLAYGQYMANIAACGACHTPMEKGEPLPGMAFAGGNDFTLPFGTIRSSNLTPDPVTGIGSWSRRSFIERFKAYADSSARRVPVMPGEFNTVMPWLVYAGMSEEDLGAIYAYLRTLPPVQHQVERFTPKP